MKDVCTLLVALEEDMLLDSWHFLSFLLEFFASEVKVKLECQTYFYLVFIKLYYISMI